MQKKLEIACFNVESCFIAQEGGADRIEFCSGYNEGGTTPDMADFLRIKEEITLPIYIMIRPRGGNFVYNDEEWEMMKKTVVEFKEKGADGLVFGILNRENEIDEERNYRLVHLAGGLPCTFHRAFDRTNDMMKSFNLIKEIGFSTLLTSGFAKNVIEGKENLESLVKIADSVEVMAGGGLRSAIISEIKNATHASWYHSSAILHGEVADIEEIRKLKSYLV